MSGAATTRWARTFADELARAGVREVVLAPGSRSTPLVMAFAGDDRFRLRVHLDERSAGFFALGVGKAAGIPAALVTTSGTAAANLLPAVVEASMSGVPLLALTADRPHRLRDADANQAIDQLHLFGRYTRAFFEAAPPTLDEQALRHLRALAGRAVSAAAGPPAGPVHVNFPFDKPLEPVETGEAFERDHPLVASGRAGRAPFVRVLRGRLRAAPREIAEVTDLLDAARGVIVAGPSSEPGRDGPAAVGLAARSGFPLLADPLSGARYGPSSGAQRVAAYDLFLDAPDVAGRLAPSVIVRVGASPTSAPLQRWLSAHDGVPHVVVDAGPRWKDHGATATHYVHADPAETLGVLAERVRRPAPESWREAWRAAERAALDALAEGDGEPHEGEVAGAIVRAAPPGATLLVSSSMPVRDVDAFGHPREEPLDVLGNRGASGIDGVLSTAFGIASQREAPTLCLVGDLAFFHDQNGLLWSREPDAAVVFVLVDNDGGGIFHRLPIAAHEPHFTRLFATPHGLDLGQAAALHGILFEDASIGKVVEAVERAVASGTTAVVRVRTSREASHARQAALRGSVGRRVREALVALA